MVPGRLAGAWLLACLAAGMFSPAWRGAGAASLPGAVRTGIPVPPHPSPMSPRAPALPLLLTKLRGIGRGAGRLALRGGGGRAGSEGEEGGGGEEEEEETSEGTAALERELERRDMAESFSRQTGLNLGVSRTLLMQYNWDLRRAVDIFTGVGNPAWRPGEVGFDPNKGYRLYGPDEMATDYERADDGALERRFDREVAEQSVNFQNSRHSRERARLPPGAAGLEQAMCCNTTWESVGTAANGVMFDVEAVRQDVIITGIECAIDSPKGKVPYAVFARQGSWLDDGFRAKHDPSGWRALMAPTELELECNPLIENEETGDVEIPNGTFSPLPFDADKRQGCMGHLRVPRGQRCAIYVHGRAFGAVVFRHPVRDLEWDPEEAVERHNLVPVEDDDDPHEVTQYRYEGQGASLVETDCDGNLRVWSGTTLWDADPFSSFCPILEEDAPLEANCAAFAGVLRYYLAS